MANNLGNREKGDRKREGVEVRTGRKYSGDVEERGKVVTTGPQNKSFQIRIHDSPLSSFDNCALL